MSKFINLRELSEILEQNRDRKVVLTFHTVGDRDGVGAAVALSSYFSEAAVITPDFITNNARRMLDKSGNKQKIKGKLPDNVDLIIVLDTNTTEQLGRIKKAVKAAKGKVIFIDHHLRPKKPEEATFFDSEGYNSASSIVYELLKRLNHQIDASTAMLLLNGIISDSADFKNSTPLTFKQVSELLTTARLTYPEVMDQFNDNSKPEEKFRLIQNLLFSKIELLNGYILMYGETATHANAVADAAIKLGADAALYWLKGDKEISVSARLRPPLDTKLSMHLGVVMQETGELLGGNGGGHPCAAGAYGPNKERGGKAIEEALRQIKSKLV